MLEYVVAYTDIHWDNYTNGITLADFTRVETEVVQAAMEFEAPILFGGDRFVDANPEDEVKLAADAAMLGRQQYRIYGHYLLGNHDRWSKSVHSGNTYRHVALYKREFEHFTVIMEETRPYLLHRPGKMPIVYHAIPAGGFAKPITFDFSHRAAINICAFHDIYKNAVVDARSGRKLEGVAHEIMDDSRFSLVVGGDNHVPQDLGLKNTVGIHLGSALQHNWGDCGSVRGFWIFGFDKSGGLASRDFRQSSSAQFVRALYVLEDLESFERTVLGSLQNARGNIVRIHVQGLPEKVNKIDRSKLEAMVTATHSPRRVQVILEPWVKKLAIEEVVANQAKAQSYEDRWSVFVDAKGFDRSGEYKRIGHELIKQARALP